MSKLWRRLFLLKNYVAFSKFIFYNSQMYASKENLETESKETERDDWQNALFLPEGIFQIYFNTRSVYGRAKFDFVANLIISNIIFWFWAFSLSPNWISDRTYVESLNFLNFVAKQGFVFSIGILGFFIAGFAIFFTVIERNLLLKLAKTKKQEINEDLSQLEYIYYIFLNFFTVYFFLLCGSLLLLMFSANTSPAYMLFDENHKENTLTPVIYGLSGIIIWGIAFSLLRLKAFIWNLYRAFLILNIIWHPEDASNNSINNNNLASSGNNGHPKKRRSHRNKTRRGGNRRRNKKRQGIENLLPLKQW